MLRVGAARRGDAPLQGLTRAEDADRGVAAGDAALLRERAHGDAVDVDPLQCFGVLALQRRREAGDAAADLAPRVRGAAPSGVAARVSSAANRSSACCERPTRRKWSAIALRSRRTNQATIASRRRTAATRGSAWTNAAWTISSASYRLPTRFSTKRRNDRWFATSARTTSGGSFIPGSVMVATRARPWGVIRGTDLPHSVVPDLKLYPRDRPYLHDDRLLTLEDTVEFFNLVLGLQLTAPEKSDLAAFLRAL